MRHLLWVAIPPLVLALVLAVAALSSTHAGSAAAPIRAAGNSADAHALFLSDVDGVQTNTFVFVSDESVSGPAGEFAQSSVQLRISRFDPAKPEGARNFAGQAELAPDQFQVSRGLSSATLNAVVTVCEETTGTECFDVTVDLTWAPSGEVSSSKEKRNQRIDGCRIHTTFSSSGSSATATGTVSNGFTDFVLGPSLFAGLSTSSFKDTTIGDCSAPPSTTPPPSPSPP